jgi:hypothetical protein
VINRAPGAVRSDGSCHLKETYSEAKKLGRGQAGPDTGARIGDKGYDKGRGPGASVEKQDVLFLILMGNRRSRGLAVELRASQPKENWFCTLFMILRM